jgi:cell division transport system permease protein
VKAPGQIPERLNPRLPGGYNLPPFGIHQFLALIIVCISLWAMGVVWLAMQAAGQWVGNWQQDIHLHVYLDSAKSDKIQGLSESLAALPYVASVRKISADEAATWMRSWLENVGLEQKELVRRLPVSFELTLLQSQSEFMFSDIRDVAEGFGAKVNEDEVNLAQAHQWLSQLSYLAWVASLILVLAMALIISNTLRMTLLARADEIHLMRLLGAREWFVRMPFILEGMLLGAGAGVLAWLLLWPLVWTTGEWFSALQVDLSIWGLLLPLLFGGGLVGGLGAVIATARVVSSQSSS